MGTPFKMKGFSGFGNSPIKQKNFNMTGSSASGDKILTKQEQTAKHKKSFDKFQAQKQKAKNFVKGLKKGANRALGVLGFMGAGTLNASAGNVSEKSEGEQIKNLLTKHKLKGGKN